MTKKEAESHGYEMWRASNGMWYIDHPSLKITSAYGAGYRTQRDALEAIADFHEQRVAALPELLEALNGLRLGLGCWCARGGYNGAIDHDPACLRARAAIAKARGEA